MIFSSSLLPDLDGLTVFYSVEAFQQWHHVILHNFTAALLFSCCFALFANRKCLVFLLSIISYHLHLFCDLVGSGGFDGSIWTISYFWPFSNQEQYFSWQWSLFAWQNILATALFLSWSFYFIIKRERSPFELVSKKWDRVFVESLKSLFSRLRYNVKKS
jgi:hypothetical protein